jgi:hypothetical protein
MINMKYVFEKSDGRLAKFEETDESPSSLLRRECEVAQSSGSYDNTARIVMQVMTFRCVVDICDEIQKLAAKAPDKSNFAWSNIFTSVYSDRFDDVKYVIGHYPASALMVVVQKETSGEQSVFKGNRPGRLLERSGSPGYFSFFRFLRGLLG